jgi:heme-degrading monooxygenase HmoA
VFIAMNNFKVLPGKEEAFEEVWKGRDSHLKSVPGILHFALLRGDTQGEYVSHSTWESRAAFDAWTQSEAFGAGHRGSGSMMGVLAGPPAVKLFESVLEQDFRHPAKA